MLLYLLKVENWNGQSDIVGVWVVTNELKETMKVMVDIFKNQNQKWSDMITVMTNKDFVEREVSVKVFQKQNLEFVCSMSSELAEQK